jgi:molecular chaperone GrpE (heat shock protein)
MVKKIDHSSEIKELKLKVEELDNNYKRVLADYKNQDRRFKEAQSQIMQFANATLMEKILLNIDSLELAQKHLNDAGLNMVTSQFLNTLSQEGLAPIVSDGQVFDPLTMDCIEVVSGKKDVVTETLTKGYLLYEKVLRPARVKVGSGDK